MSDRPVRTCIGCRATRSSANLIRLHLDPDDRLRRDRTGSGRGAWICADDPAGCFRTAVERRAVDRAFRRRVDRESIEELARSFDRADADGSVTVSDHRDGSPC